MIQLRHLVLNKLNLRTFESPAVVGTRKPYVDSVQGCTRKIMELGLSDKKMSHCRVRKDNNRMISITCSCD